MMEFKKGAIFDMDGTLTDTEELFRRSWMELAEEYDQVPNPEFPKAVCGSNGEVMLEIIRAYYPAVDEYKFMDDCFLKVNDYLQREVPLKVGAKEILEFFKKRNVKLAIASSNYHDNIWENLERAGIAQYFDAVVGGDDVENAKPHPDVYLKAARELGLATADCYAFEDGLNGLKSALAAGCATVMVLDLTQPDDIVAPQCLGVYDSLLDVLKELSSEADCE